MKLAGNLNFRSRPAMAGAFIAWHLAVAILTLVPVFIARPVQAQKPVTCFMRGECITSKTGNCDNEHCFEVRSECPSGQGLCYANPPAVPLIISIGGKSRVLDLSDYIATIFNYGVGIAATVATVMFMIGGFQFLTAGSSDRTSKGKERIKNAIIGMLLTFGAVILLRTVNPDILKLQMPKIEITKRKTVATCAYTETCFPCGVPYMVLSEKSGGKTAAASGDCHLTRAVGALSEADSQRYDASTQCIGKGCGSDQVQATGNETQCDEFLFRCSRAGAGETFACGHPPEPGKDAPAAPAGTSGGYACKSCKPDGASCNGTGANDACCGGFCADTALGDKCASGEPGDACDDDSECRTGKCQENWGNSCSNGEIGSPCSKNEECKTGYKCQTSGSNTCSPGKQYSYCDETSECMSGLHCIALAGYENVCMPKSVQDERDAFKAVVCNPAGNGVITDTCCNVNADCAGRGGFCNTEANNFCTDGSDGAPCNEDANKEVQCKSGFCADDTCTSGEPGSKCVDALDCKSGHCWTGGDFDVCVSGKRGSRCDDKNDCEGQNAVCTDHRCGVGKK